MVFLNQAISLLQVRGWIYCVSLSAIALAMVLHVEALLIKYVSGGTHPRIDERKMDLDVKR